jgi:hypothetical protein|tara:strand:+ start:534 stop:1445 length:912 start_codon:yes stop_codon:yes gene_type:complete
MTIMRKSVEHNSHELIFALVVCNPLLHYKEDIIHSSYEYYKHMLFGCDEIEFNKYKNDVFCRTKKDVDSYIFNIKTRIPVVDVKYVYLEGKKITTPKLKQLNRNIDLKHAKADVYVETNEGIIIGFSIKQDTLCTKSNFSVEKMLSECVEDKTQYKREMSDIRKQLLRSNGITGTNIKSMRQKANELFYDSLENTNPYWNILKKNIDTHILDIKSSLVKHLFPVNLPYDLYEFDGITFERLNILIQNVEFNEEPSYYYSKGIRRNAAKLFYKLVIEHKVFRVEIRFKGNAWTGSPQFQTHLII